MKYETGRDCPDCGVPEVWVLGGKASDTLDKRPLAYSCPHYKARSGALPCRFCGKKNSPLRQVPAPVPVSDCYCDDCTERCREMYSGIAPPHGA